MHCLPDSRKRAPPRRGCAHQCLNVCSPKPFLKFKECHQLWSDTDKVENVQKDIILPHNDNDSRSARRDLDQEHGNRHNRYEML